jgi:hypothetical protein
MEAQVIRVSAILSAAAIAVLIAGVAASSLLLVYVSVGVSALAAMLLATGALRHRDQLFAAVATGPGSRTPVRQPDESGSAAVMVGGRVRSSRAVEQDAAEQRLTGQVVQEQGVAAGQGAGSTSSGAPRDARGTTAKAGEAARGARARRARTPSVAGPSVAGPGTGISRAGLRASGRRPCARRSPGRRGRPSRRSQGAGRPARLRPARPPGGPGRVSCIRLGSRRDGGPGGRGIGPGGDRGGWRRRLPGPRPRRTRDDTGQRWCACLRQEPGHAGGCWRCRRSGGETPCGFAGCRQPRGGAHRPA